MRIGSWPVIEYWEKSHFLFFIPSHWVFIHIVRNSSLHTPFTTSQNFCYSGGTVSSFSPSAHMSYVPSLIMFVVLFWTCSGKLIFLGRKSTSGPSSAGVVSPVLSRRTELPPSTCSVLFLMYSRVLLAWDTKAHRCLMVSLMSTSALRLSLQSCFPADQCWCTDAPTHPSTMWWWMGLFLATCSTWHLPLLNFVVFLPALFSSMLRSLWTVAQPCGVLATPPSFLSFAHFQMVRSIPLSTWRH